MTCPYWTPAYLPHLCSQNRHQEDHPQIWCWTQKRTHLTSPTQHSYVGIANSYIGIAMQQVHWRPNQWSGWLSQISLHNVVTKTAELTVHRNLTILSRFSSFSGLYLIYSQFRTKNRTPWIGMLVKFHATFLDRSHWIKKVSPKTNQILHMN